MEAHFNAVIPLTVHGEWRGPADVIAVGAYLSGIVPLFGLAWLCLISASPAAV